jgi:hypothetical protein
MRVAGDFMATAQGRSAIQAITGGEMSRGIASPFMVRAKGQFHIARHLRNEIPT